MGQIMPQARLTYGIGHEAPHIIVVPMIDGTLIHRVYSPTMLDNETLEGEL